MTAHQHALNPNALRSDEHGDQASLPQGRLIAAERPGVRVEPCDLTRRPTTIQAGFPGLDIVSERFAASFRRTLSSALRQSCDIQAIGTDSIKFSDFVLQVPRPTGLFVFQMAPLPGGCAVVTDGHLLLALVDAMCGGAERGLDAQPEGDERELTHLELRLLHRLARPMGEDLAEGWRPLASLRPEFTQLVVRPELCQLADDAEAAFFSVFEIQSGRYRSPLGLLTPASAVEPLKERLLHVSRMPAHARHTTGGQIAEHLPEVEVEVCVELGRAHIDLRTLLNLAEGDVLRLDARADAPLVATIEGEPKFTGRPEASGSALDFKIEARRDRHTQDSNHASRRSP